VTAFLELIAYDIEMVVPLRMDDNDDEEENDNEDKEEEQGQKGELMVEIEELKAIHEELLASIF
jgi:hypothetical protein